MTRDPLTVFSPPVRAWFETSFVAATPPQVMGWPAIASGKNTLILSPTGSGKTLAAFLWGLDRLMTTPVPEREKRTRLLYISPLRALAVDVEKNLRAPLRGITLAGERIDSPVHVPTVGMRTGDTPADQRRKLVRNPPDLLITTPESLYLMLTSAARETLRNVDAVIIDEIHSVAGTKRGAHMALTLERLEHLIGRPVQRIGLSATQRPLEEIAKFLGGKTTVDGVSSWRDVEVIDAGAPANMDIEVVVPVEDMADLSRSNASSDGEPSSIETARSSIWPSVHPKILEQIKQHSSTIVFVNSRRLAERLAGRLNDMWDSADAAGHLPVDTSDRHLDEVDMVAPRAPLPDGAGNSENGGANTHKETPAPQERGTSGEVARIAAHHGSLSKVKRLDIEDQLKQGKIRAIVATSSLELGIDMGAVDLVIQVESPGAVSRGLQRVGRAGHQVGATSIGKIFPKHRSDLLETAVVVERMLAGQIEQTRYPRNPIDVLAQQIVAMTALEDWPVDELVATVRGAANFAELSDEVFDGVLDLLSGRYPSEEFKELRPRIVWDRVGGVIRSRKGAQRLAVTNAGTIPDRGLFGVFLPDGTRVGELDEEMVYESRPGETFLLGASTWRIEDITFERVVVTPAPGEPGKMPFWHGDGPGRPIELGQALGAFVREVGALPETEAISRLTERNGLDGLAARNVVNYVGDQREATGVVPDDRTIVVERFRDEIGDWRVCVLSPFGAQVHAPWGMALRAKLAEQWGMDVEMMWSDDGIVIRLPESAEDVDVDDLRIDPSEIDEAVVAELPGSALFASRFRECAGRSLLLPRRRPDQRTPLWQQRQRSADLLKVASKYPSFPILLEATRECVNDVFDVPALRGVLQGLADRSIRMVAVETSRASPFAQSLLFGWIAVYMYEGDAPLAERRAAALSLDRDLLRDLLGAEELRELLDPGVLADLELELQRLVDGRRARDGDELHDLLRILGPLERHEIDARCTDDVDIADALEQLTSDLRVIEIGIGSARRFAASEDAGRLRDAIGVAVPVGLPGAYTDSVDDPLADLALRFARTHGPFVTDQFARRYGVAEVRAVDALERLVGAGHLVRGEFRPDGTTREWVDEGVLRQLRRRSLASLRAEVAPVEAAALGRFLPAWQGVGIRRRGPDGLAEVIGVLQGAALPASVLERSILPARMADYRSSDLDALCTSGEVVWVGAGAIGSNDGRIRLAFRDQIGLLITPNPEPPSDPLHDLLRAQLATGGASFWHDLSAAANAGDEHVGDAQVLAALWDLVWAGEVTNDSLAALRSYVAGKAATSSRQTRRRPRVGQLRSAGPPQAAGRWSLVSPLLQPEPSSTQRATAQALQLVERYGVLTREAALGEGITGGFAGVYPVLKALEERGDIRRGYFVEGLGAAQFALPGAVDRIRASGSEFDDAHVVTLAATDPAQPYGASLRWPDSAGRPARVAGAHVVMIDGLPAVFIERGAKSLVSFPAALETTEWVDQLKELVASGVIRTCEIGKIDGEPASASPLATTLIEQGFIKAYKGLTWHGPTRR
ncbi:MAG: DEAD/DEAH box helicase [Acidimicrobiia bacterium]|nr:DEAD/DEAH box helicase [Acidimicrobiia bacterium]